MAFFNEKTIYDYIDNKIDDENLINELSHNADFMYEVIKRTGEKSYYLNCPQELKNNPDFARSIRTLFIRIRTTQIVSPITEENVVNFDEVINYINGKCTNEKKLEEYHNNPKFMLSVLRITYNKNIFKRCSYELLHNEEFINGVKELFGDTPLDIIHKLEIKREEKNCSKNSQLEVIKSNTKTTETKESSTKNIEKLPKHAKTDTNQELLIGYKNLLDKLLDEIEDLTIDNKNKIKFMYAKATDEQKYVAILMIYDYINSRKVIRGNDVYKAYKYSRKR